MSSRSDIQNESQIRKEKSGANECGNEQTCGRPDANLIDSTRYMGYEMKLPGMTKPLKPIPVFKQMPGESKKKFFRRMDLGVQSVLKRKQYEDKYDVDVIDDPETGQTKIQDRTKDEVGINCASSLV